MEGADDNAWVFDSLVGFLHGPVWNVPLQTFIEEKSLREFSASSLNAFEPTDDGEVLDRPEYKKIHDEYRNLAQLPVFDKAVWREWVKSMVDVMLGSFMEDIGITADQFEAACRLSARDLAGLPAYFHRRLFEQIWAANDYEMFAKMMTHKNVELQLQALELIERRYGAMPNIFSSDNEDLDTSRSDESDGWPDCDDVMTELKNKLQLAEEFDEPEEIATVPPMHVVAERKNLLSKLHSFEKKEEVSMTKLSPDEESVKKTVIEPPRPPPKKVEVSEEEMKVRQEYLKQQRDKLLALKKQVRAKRLGDAENEEDVAAGGEGSQSKARPRSARVAAAALAGHTPPPPPDAMQLRRALATKLKTEVVDTKL